VIPSPTVTDRAAHDATGFWKLAENILSHTREAGGHCVERRQNLPLERLAARVESSNRVIASRFWRREPGYSGSISHVHAGSES
jgi:hypothetical protein